MEPQNSPNQSVLSNLQRKKGWFLSGDDWFYNYQEFWFTENTLKHILNISQSPPNINLSSSHTLICTHPKCGTTWLKALTFAIVTRSHYQCPQESPLLKSNPHTLISYLESPRSIQNHDVQNQNVPLFSTHMPYSCLPKWILESDCKIVYVCRDPKDVFVSRWHFIHKLEPVNNDFETPSISMNQAFDLFCRGISSFGPLWDHTLEYWKASLDNPDKVLFLKYEKMIGDPISHVISIAKFIGFPFSNDEELKGAPLKIVEMCKFESLSNLEVNNSENKGNMFGNSFGNDVFFRKGKVGDWKNYLTPEMAEKIDQVTEMKLAPYGLHL